VSPGGASGSGLSRALRRFGYRKNVDRLLAEARQEGGLAKTLTARDLVVLGVAGIIGAGIFVLIGQGILLAGMGVVPAFLVSAAICAVAGLAYAELASTIPASGSAYAYIYTALGEFPGWLVAWALVLEYAIGAVSVAVGWRNNLLALINQFKDSDPTTDIFATKAQYWWTHNFFEHVTLGDGTVLHGVVNIPSVIIVLLCTALLIKGTKESAKVTSVLVVLKVSILILAIIGGFLAFNAVNFHDPYPHSLADDPNTAAAGDAITIGDAPGFLGAVKLIFAAGAIMFFAYIGFDSVSTTAEETKDPKRDMPRGILGSLAIVAVLYVSAALALSSASNWTQYVGNSVAATNRAGEPFGYLFEQNHFLEVGGFGVGAMLVRIGALIGTTSVLLVLILGGVRVFFNMSRDGLLPKWLARISTRGSPAAGTAFYGAFTAVFASLLTLGKAVNLVNIGTLFAFFMVILSVWVFRAKRPDIERPFRMGTWNVRGPLAWVMLVLLAAFGVGLLFVVGLKGVPVLVLGILMVAAFVVVGGVLRRRNELPVLVILGLLGTFALTASLDHFTLKASLIWTGLGCLLYAFYSIPRSKEAHHMHVKGGGEAPALTTGVTHEMDLAPDLGRGKAADKANAETSYQRPSLRGGDVDVIDLEGVGPVFAQHLNKAGYYTAYQLRDGDAAAIARQADVPEGEVRKWQQMASLLPVNGIGPQYAEALVRSGVHSLDDLSARQPAALAKTVHKVLASKDVTVVGQPVTEKRAASWIADAKRLAAKAPKGVAAHHPTQPAGGYHHHGYTLYRRDIESKGGSTRPLYFFAKAQPKSGNPSALPAGYSVGTNDRTGLPFLRKA
jgi:APA family basic amino acid/polyamine antiporter